MQRTLFGPKPAGISHSASLRDTFAIPANQGLIGSDIVESLTQENKALKLKCLKLEDQTKRNTADNQKLRFEISHMNQDKDNLIESHN